MTVADPLPMRMDKSLSGWRRSENISEGKRKKRYPKIG
jgi:hypothetical protein